VAGALTAYDLPDLAACIVPRKLTFIGMLNAIGKPASKDLIMAQMAFPRAMYGKRAPGNLVITPGDGGASQTSSDWLEK
jgi:hypothetical protein